MTPDAPTCSVLRCQGEIADLHVLENGWRRIELPVCKAHHDALVGGAEHFFDSSDRVLVMGKDLRDAGLRLVSSVVGISGAAGLPDGSLTLDLEYADGDTGHVLLSKAAMAELRELFDQLPTRS